MLRNTDNTIKLRIYLLLLSLLPILILLTNIKRLIYNCLNAVDFSIYQQPIYQMAATGEINPYSTVRNLHVFSDHFNPVLILAAPVVKLFNYNPLSLITFEWLFFVSGFIIIYHSLKHLSGNKRVKAFLFMATIILFSKGLLAGLEFPIHPGTWSTPIWFLLIYNIKKEDLIGITLSSLALCFFRESFPFAIIGLSVYYLLAKRFKYATPLLIIGALFTVFNFKLRAIIMGNVVNYGGALTEGLFSHPFQYLLNTITVFDYTVLFKLLYPFIIPIAWIIKNEIHKKERFNHPLIASAFLIAPLFLLHFLANKFYFQYAVFLSAPLLAMICVSSFPQYIITKRKALIVTLLLFILSSASIYTKMFKTSLLNRSNKCSLTEEKQSSTQQILKEIDEINSSSKIAASGGIIPQALKPNMQIYQIHMFSKIMEQYDYILLERNNSGNSYPLTPQQVEQIIKQCQSHVVKIIHDDSFYFLAAGKFPKKCVLQ